MKKYLLLFVLFTVVNSCQKSDLQVNPQLNLLDELTGISKLDFSGLNQMYGDKCLKINPYSYVGDIVEESFFEFDKLLQSGKSEGEVKSSEIVKLIQSKLSPDITKLSEEEFTDLEAEVYSIILTSLSADDFFTLNYRIACFEHIISNTECLNLHSKQRILYIVPHLRVLLIILILSHLRPRVRLGKNAS